MLNGILREIPENVSLPAWFLIKVKLSSVVRHRHNCDRDKVVVFLERWHSGTLAG